MNSLAVLVYTDNKQGVKKFSIDNNWFNENEIEVL